MTDSGIDELPKSAAGIPAASPLQFIEGELGHPEVTFLYRIGLAAVSLTMILLPLVYFVFVALCGYGLAHFAYDYWSFVNESANPNIFGTLFMLVIGLPPFLLGLAFIALLIKPFFAPKPEPRQSFSLQHADAPQLFALIGWICRSLNAPIPSRMDVNLSVNAGVYFRGGLPSLFANDLVLELGLPLAAGLNLSQFAGVIAHEYGHFSQGAAMRAGYAVRVINGWFYRVVYERDRWDRFLLAQCERDDQRAIVLIVLYFTRFGIWFTRRFLWVLMWIGHLLSTFLSRQMEFNADLYEIRLCGSESFVAVQRRMYQLDLGAALAEKELIQKWKREKKLFDEIPAFIVQQAAQIPAEIQSRHHSVRDTVKTRLFDFHPSDAERIRRAVAANERGVFHSTAPATSLFANFSELTRRVTLAHYRDLIGPSFGDDMLIPMEQTVRRQAHDSSADAQKIERYFLGVPTALRPIYLAENKTMAVRPTEPVITAIHTNRLAMERLLPVAQTAYAQLHDADARVLQASQAAHLLRAGFQFDPADFKLAAGDPEPALAEAERALDSANAALLPFEEAARARLAETVQLLRLCQSITIIPEGRRLEEEARQNVWVLSRLSPIHEPLLELRKDCATLDMLLQYRRRHASADNLDATLEDLCAGIQERINSIQQLTEQIRYPFEHPAGQIFVSQYLRNTEYHADPCELTLREGNHHVAKSVALHQRLLANLVSICEEVERHVLS